MFKDDYIYDSNASIYYKVLEAELYRGQEAEF
jgi:hypothetical protein